MQGVIAAFAELDSTVHAIEDLRKQNFRDISVYSPVPRHELEHAIAAPESKVRRFTLIGGLLGVTFGYWIPIWISDYWPLVVGGKAVASWIPYTIIGFELMVLIGSLSTVFGMFALSRIPRLTMTVGNLTELSSWVLGCSLDSPLIRSIFSSSSIRGFSKSR